MSLKQIMNKCIVDLYS